MLTLHLFFQKNILVLDLENNGNRMNPVYKRTNKNISAMTTDIFHETKP